MMMKVGCSLAVWLSILSNAAAAVTFTEIANGVDEFVRVRTEPRFNFFMLNVDTAAGSSTTCTVSSINTVDLILAIRYGNLPDAFGTAGTDYDCMANVNAATIGSNSETCAASTTSTARAFIQVIADDISTTATDNAMDIRCDTTTNAPTPAPVEPAQPAPTPGACFSSDMTVLVRNKGRVSMKELQVGDLVQTIHPQTFQPIYAMAHVQKDAIMEYLEIETMDDHASTSKLEISGDHLLFVQGKENPVAAKSLVVGDALIRVPEMIMMKQDTTTIPTTSHHTVQNTTLTRATTTTARVTNIETVYRQGMYAPITPDGTIVVNGILTSTYVSILGNNEYMQLQQQYTIMSWQTFIHVFYMAPIRLACLHYNYHATRGICHNYLTVIDTTMMDTGYAKFASVGFQLAEWANRQNLAVQMLLLVWTMAVLAPMALWEQVLVSTNVGVTSCWCAVVMVATTMILVMTRRVSFSSSSSISIPEKLKSQ
ncbi:HintC [Seminavis robusta]|uniref:HintC n=1 Tax=Seminavis robusta TaxID=568900 RepID=A0A9N8EZP9_9STRA|nr:HintC [Seminavis robusta]|eukprot:Sro2250_g320810.1 HintC (484) ;mRNA; f:8940-10499